MILLLRNNDDVEWLGFTGTSLFIDPNRELVISLLTNEVFNGRQNRVILDFRSAVHKAIVEEIL